MITSLLRTNVATRLRPDARYMPIVTTIVLLIAALVVGNFRYIRFPIDQVLVNILIGNSFLIVLAVGMTFVILSGGIDLSVGANLALSAMLVAWLVEIHGWPMWVVLPLVLAVGASLGLAMGAVIHFFEIQPFIVTLAGMFLARGLTYVISLSAISVTDVTFRSVAQARIQLPGLPAISPGVVIALLTVVIAAAVLHRTRLGRTTYAIGGSPQSALLMGLPVPRVRITVYVISGFCSSLGGILFAGHMLSGYALHGVGMELDAIAAVVIGGTLLTGGSGFVVGSLLGVMVLGMIQTIITFEGTLSSWWTRIVIGVLLFLFIVLQRVSRGSFRRRRRLGGTAMKGAQHAT